MKRVLPWIRWALRDQAMLLLVLCLVGLALPWNYFLQAAGEMLRELREQVQEKPLLTATGYVAVFTATTGLSVPGPTSLVFAVLGGWLFGWYAVPL
ncbi:MAG TPA: hypothetical protein PKD72_12770, partial [Gemmatales bacterium]|nr:hypothetical protein [Gemmatales bacterium]